LDNITHQNLKSIGMQNSVNRRDWLKSGTLGALGLLLMGAWESAQAESILPPAEVIKLSSNENPYGPSKSAQKAIVEALMKSNRYAGEHDLIQLTAKREKVAPECIVLGAGSTELLYLIASWYGRGKTVVLPEITFSGFVRFCNVLGANVLKVPLTEKMDIDLKAMEKAITADTNLIFVANPNNPTGTILSSNDLKEFCLSASQKATVFVDEAYIEFAQSAYHGSMIELVRQNHNIIITRTFSKIYGLAGLRLGYLIAKPEIAKQIRNIRVGLPNVLGITAAIATYLDYNFLEMVKQKNEEVKAYFTKELDKMKMAYLPTPTNFLYVNVNENANEFRQKLEKQNILITARESANWARITIGTKEEMTKLANAMQKLKS
jgi:histidinol-phosphate aminotransferase